MSSGSDNTQSSESNDIPDCDEAGADTQGQQHDDSNFEQADVTEESDSPSCNLSENISRKRDLHLKHRQSSLADMKSPHRTLKQNQTAVRKLSGSTGKCGKPNEPRSMKENSSCKLPVKWSVRQSEGLIKKKKMYARIKLIKWKGFPSMEAASVSTSAEPIHKGSCRQESVYESVGISQGETLDNPREPELQVVEDPLKLSAIKFRQAGENSSESSGDPSITTAAWSVLCAEQENESSTKISLKPVNSRQDDSRRSRDSCFVNDAASAPFLSCDKRCNPDCPLHMLGTKMVTNPYKLQRIVMCMCEGMSKLMNSKEMSIPSSDITQVPSTSVRTRASQRSTEREKQAGDRSPTSVQAELSEDAESLRDTRQDSSDSDYKVSSTDKSDSEDEDWEAQSTKASKKKVSRTSRTRSKSDGKTRSPAKRRGRKPVDRFCTICQKEFITIERHMLIHNSTRSFKCDECGKAFFEMRVLQKHKATHENKFKCNVCGEQFSKVRQARRHARIHVAEKPYVCEVCKRPFRARRELRKHMLVHSNVRQYMCHICGHSSRLLSQFKAHQRSHTGEKPYVCEICGKAFRYSSGLRVHSFSHTTGKPYRCLICNESFAHNYLLKRHRLSHDETESAPCETQELSTITIELPDSNTLSEQSGTPLQLRLVEFLPKTNMQHHSSEYSSEISIPSLNQTLQLEHPAPSQLLEQTPQDPNTSTQTSDSPPQIQPSKESEDFTACQSNALPQLQSQNPATSQQLLNEQIMQAGDASLIHTFLGPEMLKENLMYGPGSRRRTVEDCLVVPLSKESIKGQHSDSKTSVGMS